MEVVFVVGGHNAGKSTLVRSLTGAGQNWNDHIARGARNVHDVEWTSGRKKTLVMVSSLNEGNDHAQYRPGVWRRPGTNLVAAGDLSDFLDHYQTLGARRAILPISLSVRHAGFAASHYQAVMTGGSIGAHPVTQLIALRSASPFAVARSHLLQNAHQARNRTAAQARALIGLI